jgi:hypothetical protein
MEPEAEPSRCKWKTISDAATRDPIEDEDTLRQKLEAEVLAVDISSLEFWNVNLGRVNDGMWFSAGQSGMAPPSPPEQINPHVYHSPFRLPRFPQSLAPSFSLPSR